MVKNKRLNLNKMVLEKYLNNKYEFSPYIHEIGVMLPATQALILCNLINKLPGFNFDAKIKKHYGFDYHFSYNQNSIFENELGLAKQTFRDNLEKLSKYVTYDGDRSGYNKNGYNTTYFKLNLGYFLFVPFAELLLYC